MHTPVNKAVKRDRRRARVRAKVNGTKERPRLSVFRSSKHIYAQLIDDTTGATVLSLTDNGIKPQSTPEKTMPQVNLAYATGKALAEAAKQKKITHVVFDRAGYQYHGRVRALAEGARDGGLIF